MQGVKDKDEGYLLTDPALHSRENLFGGTDLGKAGMEAFFRQHNCTQMCKNLGLD